LPKRYEDEIRDILKGLNEFPGEAPPRRQRPRFTMPSLGRTGLRLDAQRIMGGALILMLFAWILRGPWTFSPYLVAAAGYISLLSIVLFVVALVMLVRGGTFGGGGQAYAPTRWRGQVIEMPRRGSPVNAIRGWWRRLKARFSRNGSGRAGPRGRDSFQW
jgi:hypothetical protein